MCIKVLWNFKNNKKCGAGGGAIFEPITFSNYFKKDENKKLELMIVKHYAPNRRLYIKVTKLRTGWVVQRCHTNKIAVPKYSKSTAGISPKYNKYY